MDSPIDVNQARAEDLAQLPGIGPRLAQRILAHRRQIGRFDSLADLSDVAGVSPRMVRDLEPFVSLVGSRDSAPALAGVAGDQTAVTPMGDEPSLSAVAPASTMVATHQPLPPEEDRAPAEAWPRKAPPAPRTRAGVNPWLAGLVGGLLGAAAALGALFVVNGSLRYVDRGQAETLALDLEDAVAHQEVISATLGIVGATLDAQGGRLDALEPETKRSTAFLDGLRDLVGAVLIDEDGLSDSASGSDLPAATGAGDGAAEVGAEAEVADPATAQPATALPSRTPRPTATRIFDGVATVPPR